MGEEAKLYNGNKAWSSINHSILLGFLTLSVHAQHGAFICCLFRSKLFVRHYGWVGCLQETVEKVRKGERVPNMSEDQIWAAKHLYDSAYHPDTGRLPLIRSGIL